MRVLHKRRVVSLLLAIVILAGAWGPAALAAPAQIPFDEIEPGEIHLDELQAVIDETLALSADASNQDAVAWMILEINAWQTSAVTTRSLRELAYYQNLSDSAAVTAYTAAAEAYAEATGMIFDCLRALLGSPCAGAVEQLYSSEDIASLTSGDADRMSALSAITSRYISAYNDRMNQTYATYDDLVAAVGTLYLEMIRELSAAAGSGEEAVRLFYESYGRTGTYADYEPMREAVRETFGPALLRLWLLTESTEDETLGGEATLAAVADVVREQFPPIADAVNYLLEYGYYDVTPGADKYTGGFTTYLYEYEAPFLYYPTEGGITGVDGISHELGHYYHYYEYGSTGDLDSAEVHSQGLELLCTLYYDELHGERADAAELIVLSNVAMAVIDGCIMDEFQYEAFTNPPADAAGLQALYASILDEYGLGVLADNSAWAYYWTIVPHSFSQPMYYLSYAVSALPALELWAMAQDDPDGAKASYYDFTALSSENGFAAALRAAGLSDPYNGAAVSGVVEELDAYLAGSDNWLFSDIATCWGATEIQWFAWVGGINGYADGTYRPNGTLTRAQMASVLTNLLGMRGVTSQMEIADVPAAYWAHDEIAIVLSFGLMTLDETGGFRPDEPLTRQEMAAIAAALLSEADVTAEPDSTPYTDDDQIRDDCREAVQIMRALGVMAGRADGSFDPDGSLTRQQMAVVFFRLYECMATA